MSDKFFPIPLPQLLELTLSGIRQNRFMGIPGSLFYNPRPHDPYKFSRYGCLLATPIGVAAGPHTQMAINIIAAWLCGARYIELKTVQTLDELKIAKPCIDMRDEGYNCEWSQELRIEESFNEYLNAWIIIHILQKELGFGESCGTIFNMSVGYHYDGIKSENVQWFLKHMSDCKEDLTAAKNLVRKIYPSIDEILIPDCISNNVTLSTMHGCPPDEIEKIGLYLIREKKLHTTIKLNPTLLGAEELRGILNTQLGFTTVVPDLAFDHDLKYPDALRILGSLDSASDEQGLQFSIKLTNTLESINNKDIFDASEPIIYMSGRALHPISINLARKLQNDRGGSLDISFSGGVDCFNIADVLACGIRPVTVCTDLLKPGGYGRLHQYLENLRSEFGIKQEIFHAENKTVALANLNDYADRVIDNPAYHRPLLSQPSIKTSRELGWFDCIHAPCADTCPTHQEIPGYLRQTASGNIPGAFETIFRTNPFPSVTGMICDHPCQIKCTRINYDEPLRIREIKRFVAENTTLLHPSSSGGGAGGEGHLRAAIIGAGPAGLSCGWFLNRAGFRVDIYEQKKIAGGMISSVIPSFRLTGEAIESDIRRILDAGVRLHEDHPVDRDKFAAIKAEHDVVFIAAGAQRSALLKIDGIQSAGVLDPLEFLAGVKQGRKPELGSQVLIIGGGNTAMDAARAAVRLVGSRGKVTIVYRRTIKEMPADKGEIRAVLEEGIKILELVNPKRIISVDGHSLALVCSRNTLVIPEKDSGRKDNRLVPVKKEGSEFEIHCDSIIPAVGQELAIDFLDHALLITNPGSYKTLIPGLFIGGDAMRGASTAINAIADGRLAAEEILSETLQLHQASADQETNPATRPEREGRLSGHGKINLRELMKRKATREFGFHAAETTLDQRRNFDLVISSLSPEEAKNEAARCLNCDELCHVCVTVCPNLANFGYEIEPVVYSLQKAVVKKDGSVTFEKDIDFKVDQPYQILNIRDLCNECGNCTTFCPGSGRPFGDKPGICLSAKSFEEEEKGFLLKNMEGIFGLTFKDKGKIHHLRSMSSGFVYTNDEIEAVINKSDFSLVNVKFIDSSIKEFHFDIAAEMSVIMQGAMELMHLIRE